MNHRTNAILSACAILLGALGFWVAPHKRPAPDPVLDVVLEAPMPLEEWTVDAGIVRKQTQQALLGKLPSPLPNQKTKDCDPELGEQERRGGCWMRTDVPPPCPKDKQWEEDGFCFRPIPRMAKTPTSGGGQVPAIAE